MYMMYTGENPLTIIFNYVFVIRLKFIQETKKQKKKRKRKTVAFVVFILLFADDFLLMLGMRFSNEVKNAYENPIGSS